LAVPLAMRLQDLFVVKLLMLEEDWLECNLLSCREKAILSMPAFETTCVVLLKCL
jgi:hypothetical protein